MREEATGRKETQLAQHAEVVAVGVMLDDFSIAQHVPVHVGHCEPFSGRRCAYRQAVQRHLADTAMSSAYSRANNHNIA